MSGSKKTLKLTDVLGNTSVFVQGKEVTVQICGKLVNKDKYCFQLKEETQTFAISTMLSGKNEEPISTTLSYVNASAPTELRRKAFVVDLAYIHMKSQMTTWSLLDNALNGIEFAKVWVKIIMVR